MTTWIGLLRGVNVTGHNKINMRALQAAVSATGFHDVRTYIQSGNLVFRSDKDAAAIAAEVERVITETFGLSITVILRSADELAAVAASPVYADAPGNRNYVTFLREVPVTARPYNGSAAVIVCPPRIGAPAAMATSAPPRRISLISPAGRSSGKPPIARAKRGSPPIAKTSEMAFVAAIRPNSYGSSTGGVKKSTVWTRPTPSAICTTAPSSKPVVPARTRGSVTAGRSRSRTARSAAGSLHAQPPPAAIDVSRGASLTRPRA